MAVIAIGHEWVDLLDQYVEGLQAESIAAAEQAAQFLRDTVVAKAKADPEWMGLADAISVWSQDGELVIGVQDNAFVSQAFQLEYGDEVRPPNALFRTLAQDVALAGDVMTESMQHLADPVPSVTYLPGMTL